MILPLLPMSIFFSLFIGHDIVKYFLPNQSVVRSIDFTYDSLKLDKDSSSSLLTQASRNEPNWGLQKVSLEQGKVLGRNQEYLLKWSAALSDTQQSNKLETN